jgi:hypothetical protein
MHEQQKTGAPDLLERAQALFVMSSANYNRDGKLQAAVLFDVQHGDGRTIEARYNNATPDTPKAQDALRKWIRFKCNAMGPGHVVAAVYVVTTAWGSARDMTRAELSRVIKKYKGGPASWPANMRKEYVVVTGENRLRSVTVKGAINPATRVVEDHEIHDGDSEGRMSRFFEPAN